MNKIICKTGRRQFLSCILPCAAFCMGNAIPLALAQDEKPIDPEVKHKFQTDSGMTLESVFQFAFRDHIRTLQFLWEYIGTDLFIESLKKSRAKAGHIYGSLQAETLGSNSFETYVNEFKKPSKFWDNVLTTRIIEDTPNAFEVEITECLWAKTFRDADAPDLGYICICHPDFAMAEGFNPKIKLIRTKTLMQGHDCCNHRWVFEA